MSVVDPSQVDYAVHAILTDGTDRLIPVSSLAWEEQAGALATTISLSIPDAPVEQGQLTKLVALGTPITVLATMGGGAGYEEVARGTIWDITPPAGSSSTFSAIAYDPLIALTKSKVDLYYPTGKTPGWLIRDLASRYNVPLGSLHPMLETVTFGAQLIRGKTIAATILEWLQQSYEADGNHTRLVTRSNKGKLDIVKSGTNEVVYWIMHHESSLGFQQHLSMLDMVNRVIILGQSEDDQATPVVATLDGDQRMGVWQETMYLTEHKTVAEVEKAARLLLNQKGVPSNERTLSTFDIPSVRKFDKLHVTDGTLDDLVVVESVTHDADARTMNLVLGNLATEPTAGVFTLLNEGAIPDESKTGGKLAKGGSAALTAAIKPWLGTRYLMGGTTKAGVDCSAFVQAVYATLGVSLPRVAQAQYNATKRVATPKVGDLVFFSGTYATSDFITHVGIITGGDQMAHAGDPCQYASTSTAWFKSHFAGYGRIGA